MCRRLTFAGTCTSCGEAQTWDDLSQELACLEAKNNGVFGECETGIFEERHNFDQECDRCSEEDEGVGDVGDELVVPVKATEQSSDATPSNRKKQKV